MTLTETILARASGRDRVQPGDNIWVNTDVLLTHDVCGPGTIGVFHREFGRDAKVWDRNRRSSSSLTITFSLPIVLSNRNVDILRDFVREQQLPVFLRCDRRPGGSLDVRCRTRPAQTPVRRAVCGRVSHGLAGKRVMFAPAKCLFGTDSHTCMAGAFGEFATGIGNTDAGFIMGTGKLLVKVPETMRFHLDGALQKGRDGQGCHPARHRRDRFRRRDVPRDAVGRSRCEQPRAWTTA